MENDIIDVRNFKICQVLGIGNEKTKNLISYLSTIDFSDISNILYLNNFDVKNLQVIEYDRPVYIKKYIVYGIYSLSYKRNPKLYLSKVEKSIYDIIKCKLLEYHDIKNINDIVFTFDF